MLTRLALQLLHYAPNTQRTRSELTPLLVTMKAAPLLVSWHNDNTPIYSAHFEPHGKGRLATAGGDNNVRVCEYTGTHEQQTVLTVGSSGKSMEAEKTEA